MNLRNMEKAVKPTHFPMPNAEELRHKFAGSDRFSVMDMNHASHQFPIDKESSELCTFYTPWSLYKYETLVMGVHTASNGCQEKTRLVLDGCQGMVQIDDAVIVHGKGAEHDKSLVNVLHRLSERGFTLGREKCKYQVIWFGNTYSKHGMSPDPEKVNII